MNGARAAMLPDGRRLHLHHGPIDLIVEAWGEPGEIEAAYAQAIEAFAPVLATLVGELPILRTPLGEQWPTVAGPVARRMVAACRPYRAEWITPMAAVAGAVADHVLAAMLAGRRLDKAYVNDGGDIAVHLAPGRRLVCGVAPDLAAPSLLGTIAIDSTLRVGGIATSGAARKGQGGRSFSLGIADAVTILAADAAAADAAATVVANAVDLPGHRAILRQPAVEIDPESDLGERLVAAQVGPLAPIEIELALARGVARAETLRRAGLIGGAVLVLRHRARIVGAVAPALEAA